MAFRNAREQLDFCSVTGHALWPDMPAPDPTIQYIVDFHEAGFARLRKRWETVQQTTAAFHRPGDFVTFLSFEMHGSADGDVTIVYPGARGGGMYNNASSPRLTNVVFSGNDVSTRVQGGGNGGGMLNTNGSSPVLNHVTFRYNDASLLTGKGGGVYNSSSSSPVLTDVTFYQNYAGRGGGIYNSSDHLRLTNTGFQENKAIYANPTSAPGIGGGIYNNGNSLTLINVTFNGNYATFDAGGIYNNGDNSTLVNVVFSDNSAGDDGGGMYNTGNLSLTNVSLGENSADGDGNGIYNSSSSSPTAANSIFWQNDIYIDSGGMMTISYSLIEGGWPSGATCSHIITDNPLLVSSPDDLHLQSNSPAIDAGDNTAIPTDTFDLDGDGDTGEPILYDLEGDARFTESDTGNGTPPIVNMGAYEAVSAVEVAFSAPSYVVNESAGTATITATLSLASSNPVTVNYATASGSATSGADYTSVSGTLIFTPGLESQTFEVPIADEALDEEDETILLSLSNPVSATLGANNLVTLTIMDNDNPPTVGFSSATYNAGEEAGSTTIDVVLSTASGLTVTVAYSTTDGTATAGEDYTPISGTLIFTPGITSQSFTVNITDDEVDEGNEAVTLVLSSASNASIGVTGSVQLNIIDDDGQPTIRFSAPTYGVNESAGSALITTTLNTPYSLTVVVNYATTDDTATAGSDYITASGTWTFHPGVISQAFTVSIIDDILEEENEILNLALSHPVNGTLLPGESATLTILDDDGQFSIYLPLVLRNHP